MWNDSKIRGRSCLGTAFKLWTRHLHGQMQHWTWLLFLLYLSPSLYVPLCVAEWGLIIGVTMILTSHRNPPLSRHLRIWRGNGLTYSNAAITCWRCRFHWASSLNWRPHSRFAPRLEAQLWVDVASSMAEGGIMSGDFSSCLAFLVLHLEHSEGCVLTGFLEYSSNVRFMIF